MRNLGLIFAATFGTLLLGASPSTAQTARVVLTCPSATQFYQAGQFGQPTIDIFGNACGSGGGSGGATQANVFGSVAGTETAVSATTISGQTALTVDAIANGLLLAAINGPIPCLAAASPSTVSAGTNPAVCDLNGRLWSNNVFNGAAPSLTNPIWLANAEAPDVTGTFTNATQTTSVTNSAADGYASGLISINGTYATAAGVFEVSDDAGTTFYSIQCARSDGSGADTGYTALTNVSRQWTCPVGGNDSLRVRSTAVATGTVNARVGVSAPPPPVSMGPAGGPSAITPGAGTAHIIATGGTAVTFVTGPVKGCYVFNPLTATDQNIVTAEPLYVNIVVAATTSSLNGSSTALAPGQPFNCPAGMTTNLSANAVTSAHNAVVITW